MTDCIFTFTGSPQLIKHVIEEIQKLDGSDSEYWDDMRRRMPNGRESIEVQALDMTTLKRCLSCVHDFATSVDAELENISTDA